MADLYRDFGAAPALSSQFTPRISGEELDDTYRVVADVPGVEAKDLDVSVEEGVMTIKGVRRYAGAGGDSGEKTVETTPGASVAVSDGEGSPAAKGIESSPGASFERKLRFPGEILETDVRASLKNGVLTVVVPKRVEAKPEVRSIPVETA